MEEICLEQDQREAVVVEGREARRSIDQFRLSGEAFRSRTNNRTQVTQQNQVVEEPEEIGF